jgi:WD40-like Beta Propeller Repeat
VFALLGIGHAGTARASYPGADGLIAFVRGGDIYTIKADGLGLRRLAGNGHDSGPRWSPNGSRIAYLDSGNLWIMTAAGDDKTQLTHAAPWYTEARPSWSPNGRYLAFVETEQRHRYGYLTRYDTVTHQFATFSTPYHSESPTVRQIKVTALPEPVAWGWALSAGPPGHPGPPGSFIVVEGALSFCQPHDYCLVALGAPHQYQYKNQFASAEDFTATPTRLTDPDWFPNTPQFGTDVLTSQEQCTGTTCTHSGIDLEIGATPVLAGAYEAVYSPAGSQIAYVKDVRRAPEVFVAPNVASPTGTPLSAGSQPDWQPAPERPPPT